MELIQIDAVRWKIPQTGLMRVPGIVYASQSLSNDLREEEALRQVANVATLPGIVKASLAMPDIHWGYGFPIGGVAAFDMKDGIISPGGVGYDINCGVRLAASQLTLKEVQPLLETLADALYSEIPAGVGVSGNLRLSLFEEKKAIVQGAAWAIKRGMGDADDLEHTEDSGRLSSADADTVSDRALERGRKQLGTLGSGNHFMEVGVVQTVFDAAMARAFGLFKNQITLMIHSGSRGLGHQVCDDYLALMTKMGAKHDIDLVDRQLACAPLTSSTGQRYLGALACAANYAWINRQVLLHQAREAFSRVFKKGPAEIGLRLLYDVCHNIAKIETHDIDGQQRQVCVHRKGATRALPPEHPDLPGFCRVTGQPVLIPGDMGTASYVLVGGENALKETFGSTCHGAGRVLSRRAAKKAARGRSLFEEMKKRGVLVRCAGKTTMAEEMPDAYKRIDDVVEVVHEAGISRKVARIKPLVVIKG